MNGVSNMNRRGFIASVAALVVPQPTGRVYSFYKMHQHLPNEVLMMAMNSIYGKAYQGYLKLNLGDAYVEKLLYNATRKDHKLEARGAAGGKQF